EFNKQQEFSMDNNVVHKTLDTLANQYLGKSDDRATLPTRMAYLAISALAIKFSNSSIEGSAIDWASQWCRQGSDFTAPQKALFIKQLEKFYKLTGDVYDAVKPAVVASTKGLPLEEKWKDYPEFYQVILGKIKTKQLPGRTEEYIKGSVTLTMSAINLGIYNGVVNLQQGQTDIPLSDYLKSVNLTEYDVDQLVNIFSILDPYNILCKWVSEVRKNNFGVLPTTKQAEADAVSELQCIIDNTKDFTPQVIMQIGRVYKNLALRHGVTKQYSTNLEDIEKVLMAKAWPTFRVRLGELAGMVDMLSDDSPEEDKDDFIAKVDTAEEELRQLGIDIESPNFLSVIVSLGATQDILEMFEKIGVAYKRFKPDGR
ncbi:MAG: hypothetical protein WCG04_06570, partial [Alphaproteobacteria bacterium]